ncbi:type VII secretion protein EsaA [Bacillus carboniphilus]|uniref:Type VII secretion protein EsaA n=1 Tax=Bacillus carboniphilus TaxID=86663 RepID=A0ABY9JTY5_9BACI|nr:type VII secretion protein EsaA [Bacillus carboniphilus]WLR42822.1 type VII secretion protein EsaA [Bacillus carboniphilus]
MKKKVSILVLILSVMLIIATPVLFFQWIGGNPFQTEEKATQTIAVVNEDAGAEVEGDTLKFGEQVPSILQDSSSFEWTVVGRSAAENGLLNAKYDAVVYIPSDFSNKVMSYDEERPEKSNLNYQVQSQLNAVNKEKALLEIERSTKRLNKQMSSLFWNYVSTDMENIKEEFDEILQKEVDFQKVMLEFYKPTSKDLAGQLEQQTSMLTNLQSSIQDIEGRVPEQESTIENFERNLNNFIQFVDQYQEYQENQNQLLAEVQSESIEMINDSMDNQRPRYMVMRNSFLDQSNQFDRDMIDLYNSLKSNEEAFVYLKEIRNEQLARQLGEIPSFQGRMLDFYQQLQDTTVLNDLEGSIVDLNETLTKEETDSGEGDGSGDGEGDGSGDDEGDGSGDDEGDGSGDGEGDGSGDDEGDGSGDDEGDGSGDDEGDGSGDDEGEGSGDGEGDGSGDGSDEPKYSWHNLNDEIKAIEEEIQTKIEEMIKNLDEITEPTKEDIEKVVSDLGTINEKVGKVLDDLKNKNKTENPLEEEVEELKQQIIELENEKIELENTISDLNGDIKDLEDEKQELAEEINTLNDQVDSLNTEVSELKEEIESLKKENEELKKQLEMYSNNLSDVIGKVEEKEQSILTSQALSESRKELLTSTFEKEIKNYELIDVLQYYAYLDRYEARLDSMLVDNGLKDTVIQDEELNKEINTILKVTLREEENWDKVSTRMPTNIDAFSALQDSYTLFVADFDQVIEEEQTKLMESLKSINQEASDVLSRIQQPEQPAPTPATNGAGPELESTQSQIGSELSTIHSFLDSVSDSQNNVVTYSTELKSKVTNVQTDADVLNNKWATNVSSTKLIRDDVYSILGNASVDGQSNDYVYDFLTSPLNVEGDVPEEKQSANLPPVVILFIILLSSLLIGYTSFYFQNAPLWMQGVIFLLLNLIVGFFISLYGLDIYPLEESRSIEWTIFTIMLLLAGSGIVRVAFVTNRLVGWFVSVGIIALFVTPLLALTTPNFTFEDPMSKVYVSIQYGSESLFSKAAIVLTMIIIALGVLQMVLDRRSNNPVDEGTEEYEG